MVPTQHRKHFFGFHYLSTNGKDNRRILILVFFVFAVTGILCLRLYVLQGIEFATYRALADGQHTLFQKLVPNRGEIYLRDKDGLYPAAVNQITKMAYAVPAEMDNPNQSAQDLASLLGLDANDLQSRFQNHADLYEPVKHRLSDDEIQKLTAAKIPGVHLVDESYRYYPSDELASNVLGFVGWKGNDLEGRYGIEAYFDKNLSGQAGSLFQNRDASGNWISIGEQQIVPAKDGDSIVLSIDHVVQYEAEKLIAAAVTKYAAQSGLIIVMEPSTGRILAMADFPTFDPNNYSKVDDISILGNPAISNNYECGSIFKAITMAAALDSHQITPDTTYVDHGFVKSGGYTIRNSDLLANGVQTMTQVLDKSLNTGAIFAEQTIGNKNFLDYITRFGFGQKTGIDLPGEASGDLSNLSNLNSDIQFFTASFGQGITVTPIQVLSAYNAIANGGILMKPHVVDETIHPDGSEETVAPVEVRRVISQQADAQLTQMLQSVVADGHGKRGGVPGYLVVGKTGTAQVANQNARGYDPTKTIGSFAGFAPLNDPKFTVLVKIDNPKNVLWAESSAAPTFGELMKFLLDYYGIAPTESYTQQDLSEFNATHDLQQTFLQDTPAPAGDSPSSAN